MKIRRITLVALIILTVVVVLNFKFFPNRNPVQPEDMFYFEIEPSGKHEVSKTQTFKRQQDQLTSLLIKNNYGKVELESTDSLELVIEAIITAKNEEHLAKLEISEQVADSILSYELQQSGEQQDMLGRVHYLVKVPAGMEVSIKQNYGLTEIRKFVGFLQIDSDFGQVSIDELKGSANLMQNFGTLDVKRFSGPLFLETSFSTNKVQLDPVNGGYNFSIEVTNGQLQGNLDWNLNIDRNIIRTEGIIDEGQHPIKIESSFGNVVLDYFQ